MKSPTRGMSIVERKAGPKMGDEFAMEYYIYIYIYIVKVKI